jgi:DNA mismatch endonuclease (patch repair protein)
MALVRSRGNRSTEWRIRSFLARSAIAGWLMHPPFLPGLPDFFFPDRKIAVFVDGCFWHACPRCRRPLPVSNKSYWAPKIARNVARRREVTAVLHRRHIHVVRIWEHDLRGNAARTLARLAMLLSQK